jgi:hypothetical protein
MIGTNRDLIEIRRLLDREIHRLQELAADMPSPGWVDRRLETMCRQRISVCAALVNRRMEAANEVVVFARWVSGNGALGAFAGEPARAAAGIGLGWRRQS